MLLPTTRLLTLTGAGGVGKTRLALEVAGARSGSIPTASGWSSWRRWPTPRSLPQAVAAALGVAEQPGRPPTETLTAWLAGKRLLLVLDNCEHLIDACAALAEALLRACPDLRILATSREPLGLTGETAWRAPSLALPDPERLPPPAQLAEIEAVRLFVERARAAQPGFAVTEPNAAAVAQICCRLDGLPLAIELAAARLRALAGRADRGAPGRPLPAADRRQRTALPRHRTLRATIDWSHDLLTEPERALLRRLAVFAGGWTLEAAEAVCAGDGIAAAEVLDLLTRLVDKSLVQAEAGGRRRRATGCWRRCASTPGSDWPRPARRSDCASGTPPGAWRWPSGPSRAAVGGEQLAWLAGWTPSTTTCGRRWPGAWSRRARAGPAAGRPPVAVLALAAALHARGGLAGARCWRARLRATRWRAQALLGAGCWPASRATWPRRAPGSRRAWPSAGRSASRRLVAGRCASWPTCASASATSRGRAAWPRSGLASAGRSATRRPGGDPDHLGRIERRNGAYRRARAVLEEGLALARAVGDRCADRRRPGLAGPGGRHRGRLPSGRARSAKRRWRWPRSWGRLAGDSPALAVGQRRPRRGRPGARRALYAAGLALARQRQDIAWLA